MKSSPSAHSPVMLMTRTMGPVLPTGLFADAFTLVHIPHRRVCVEGLVICCLMFYISRGFLSPCLHQGGSDSLGTVWDILLPRRSVCSVCLLAWHTQTGSFHLTEHYEPPNHSYSPPKHCCLHQILCQTVKKKKSASNEIILR